MRPAPSLRFFAAALGAIAAALALAAPMGAPSPRPEAVTSAVAAASPVPTGAAPVRIGVLDFLGGEAPPVDWSRTAAHLERALPGVRVELARLELDALEAAVQQGLLDFVITNSGHAVTLEASAGLARIATLHAAAARSPEGAIGSAVVVRADRPELQRLADLRGRRLAAVAPAAFGGYLVAARELLRQDIDPQRDLAHLRFTGYPMGCSCSRCC